MEVLNESCATMYIYTDTNQFPAPVTKVVEAGMNVTIPPEVFIIDTGKVPEDLCVGKYE